MSPFLKEFYIDLDAWVKGGMNVCHPVFCRDVGICNNLSFYSRYHNQNAVLYRDELRFQFTGAGLDADFPFNSSRTEYSADIRAAATYKNPKRLAWIEEHTR